MKIKGIYKIESVIHPERCYIGSAVNLQQRWYRHKSDLNCNRHKNPKLQSHVNKYGIDDLQFSIILHGCSKVDLLFLEQCFINQYQPWFNCCQIAGSQLGRRWKLSAEAIENIRNGHKGLIIHSKFEKGQIPWNKGTTGTQTAWNKGQKMKGVVWNKGLTKETDDRVKIQADSESGKIISIETRNKLRLVNLNKKYSEEVCLRRSATITEWWRIRKNKTNNDNIVTPQ
jgi:group I intron endonuclease